MTQKHKKENTHFKFRQKIEECTEQIWNNNNNNNKWTVSNW